jgi:hypothetical protein
MKDEKFQILKLGTFQPLSVVFVSETIRDIEIWDEWASFLQNDHHYELLMSQ